MELLQLLNANGFISVNKQLIKEIGLEPAVVFGEIVSKYYYHKGRGELKKGGWFYFTADKMEKITSLSHYKQTKALNKLEEVGFIEQKNFGTPNKRHFRVDSTAVFNSLKNWISTDSKTSIKATSKLDSNSLKNYKSNKNRNKNRNNNYPPTSENNKTDLTDIEELEKRGWI